MHKDYISAIKDSLHLKFMIETATKAGEILLDGRKELSCLKTISKTTNPNDILTKYDLLVQDYIQKKISGEFSEYKIVGEEEALGENIDIKNSFVWVIDPIDGTLNFRMNRKDFSISLGLLKDGNPYAGVVYAPARDEMYIAEKGKGSFLNGNRICVRSSPLTDVPLYHFELHKINSNQIINDVLPMAAHIRIFGGSAALDLAFVASGQVDAQFSTNLNLWDIVAGFLIVSEAGGQYLSLDGSDIKFSLKPNAYSYVVGHEKYLKDILSKLPSKVISGIKMGLG